MGKRDTSPAANPQALATAIATLQANPGEAERLGANGRSRVLDRFRWENVVDRCISAYLEIKAPPPPPPHEAVAPDLPRIPPHAWRGERALARAGGADFVAGLDVRLDGGR